MSLGKAWAWNASIWWPGRRKVRYTIKSLKEIPGISLQFEDSCGPLPPLLVFNIGKCVSGKKRRKPACLLSVALPELNFGFSSAPL